MIPAVFDCMIYLQAAGNRKGAAGACLALADKGHVKLHLTAGILQEIADVLQRGKIRACFPKLTDEYVQGFLDALTGIVDLEAEAPLAYRLSRDPDDEPYLNLALAKQPCFLVTWDNDLRSLM